MCRWKKYGISKYVFFVLYLNRLLNEVFWACQFHILNLQTIVSTIPICKYNIHRTAYTFNFSIKLKLKALKTYLHHRSSVIGNVQLRLSAERVIPRLITTLRLINLQQRIGKMFRSCNPNWIRQSKSVTYFFCLRVYLLAIKKN